MKQSYVLILFKNDGQRRMYSSKRECLLFVRRDQLARIRFLPLLDYVLETQSFGEKITVWSLKVQQFQLLNILDKVFLAC